jgi:hypothetical protein
MKSPLYPDRRKGRGLLCVLLLGCPAALAQSQTTTSVPTAQPEIVSKIDGLTKSLNRLRSSLRSPEQSNNCVRSQEVPRA